MLKRYIVILILLVFGLQSQAQEDNSVFQFLRLPFSSHAAALGGENISIIENDITMAMHNPALLSCVGDKTLNLNYMTYIKGTKVARAAFSRTAGDRGAWAIAGQYLDYGNMTETTADNISTGTFSAKDIALSGMYSYDLSDYWSGGVKANFIYSKYANYSSFAVGVDLGLNYYLEESDFSISMVARNLGGQLKTFNGTHERLPFDLQLGFTKRMSHAPFRFSGTLYQLTDWKNSKLFDHAVIGMDILASDNFYLAFGYNFKRGNDMKINGSNHWAGFSCGLGLQIKRFNIGLSYAKYHISSSSLLMSFSASL